MTQSRLLLFGFTVFAFLSPTTHAGEYDFDGKISRPVLENYLSRSITMLDLLNGHGNLEDNVRMLRNTGAKFAGRTIYVWGHESALPERISPDARQPNSPCSVRRAIMVLRQQPESSGTARIRPGRNDQGSLAGIA